MSEFINNYINSINIEEEIKKQQTNDIALEANQDNENQDTEPRPEIGKMDTAVDMGASAAIGAAKGITYVADLPFYLVQGIESGSNFIYEKTAEALGFNRDETEEIKSDVEIGIENADKFKPGQWLRENVLTYESKSKLGDYAMTMGEWAAPGGILGKTTKAKNLFMTTGALSGAVEQKVTDTTGSKAKGLGVGIGLNVAMDLMAIKKGNLAILSKEFLPNEAVLAKAKKIEKDLKKIDPELTLSGAEVTGSNSMKSIEGQVSSTIAGNKVMDKYWSDRPDKLRNFIEKWGKQNGLIINNKRFVSDAEYYVQLKKAAIELQTQRSTAWLKAGGDKLPNFTYDKAKVDGLVVSWQKLAKDLEAGDAKTILAFAKNLNKTKGNGQTMHNVYREIRDTYYDILGSSNKTPGSREAVKKYKFMKESLDSLMKSNTDYSKAQKAYIKYNDEYAKPITKGSITQLFKSLENGKSAEDIGTVAKMWKFLDTKAAPKDIALMAKSINKSGVPNLWENVVSGYFQEAFLKSQSKNINGGFSQGTILHNALMSDPKKKANFTQMLFELSKVKNPNIKIKDVNNAVTSFAEILKATGQSGKAGSSTAGNLKFTEEASKSKVKFFGQGIPIKDGFINWYSDRTLSKNSKIIAEALTSDKGIQAFIDLTQDWKSYNAAFSLLRAVTVGAGEMN